MNINLQTILALSFSFLIMYFTLDDFFSNHDYSRNISISYAPSQQKRKFVILVNKTNNVCYFNCIVQSLLSFKSYFSAYEGKMANILKNFFRTIHSTDEFTVNLLPGYKRALDILKMDRFNIFKPGDAMELIHFILNNIIQHYTNKLRLDIQENFYFHYTDLEKMLKIPIVKDFYTIVEFDHSEYLWFVPVISHSFNAQSVQHILNDFFRVNKIPTVKRFIHLPNVFVVNFWRKLGNLSEIKLFDQEYIKINDIEYRLNSIIIYIKRDKGGHYFSASLVKNQWYLFDEDKITKIDLKNYSTGFIAVAIYEKIGFYLK